MRPYKVTIIVKAESGNIAVFQIEVRSENQLQSKLSGIAKSHKGCLVTYREAGNYRTFEYGG